MRLILGIILGIAITLGAAYVRDSAIPEAAAVTVPDQPGAVNQRRIVNWDVLGAVVHEQTEFAKGLWNRLVGG